MELLKGNIHMGITGIDLIEESRTSASKEVVLLSKLGFGKANVVVAVPNSWIDVENIKDLSEVASEFRSYNNRRIRVATKFKNITRNTNRFKKQRKEIIRKYWIKEFF